MPQGPWAQLRQRRGSCDPLSHRPVSSKLELCLQKKKERKEKKKDRECHLVARAMAPALAWAWHFWGAGGPSPPASLLLWVFVVTHAAHAPCR